MLLENGDFRDAKDSMYGRISGVWEEIGAGGADGNRTCRITIIPLRISRINNTIVCFRMVKA